MTYTPRSTHKPKEESTLGEPIGTCFLAASIDIGTSGCNSQWNNSKWPRHQNKKGLWEVNNRPRSAGPLPSFSLLRQVQEIGRDLWMRSFGRLRQEKRQPHVTPIKVNILEHGPFFVWKNLFICCRQIVDRLFMVLVLFKTGEFSTRHQQVVNTFYWLWNGGGL